MFLQFARPVPSSPIFVPQHLEPFSLWFYFRGAALCWLGVIKQQSEGRHGVFPFFSSFYFLKAEAVLAATALLDELIPTEFFSAHLPRDTV